MFDYLQTLFAEPLAFFDQAIFRVLAVLIGLCCHEWGHAYAAYRCGDDTAKRAGRLSLNPLAHLDPFGTLLMFFAGFGYAKPVPVNPWNYKGDRRKADIIVSLAGIMINIALFVLFTLLAAIASLFMWRRDVIDFYGLSMLLDYSHELQVIWVIISGYAMEAYSDLIALPWLVPVVRLCAYTALVNLNLAVFNLIPLPPLDGYHVFNDIVFKGRIRLSERAFRVGMLVVMILAAQGILGELISAVVYPAQRLLLMPISMIWG
ncbi:MAG: site-2 protease family protein [Clostridia bacterium]|nr:site-2 protease family protein [Clostridia bacterium]